MPADTLDTSALAKHYHLEVGSIKRWELAKVSTALDAKVS